MRIPGALPGPILGKAPWLAVAPGRAGGQAPAAVCRPRRLGDRWEEQLPGPGARTHGGNLGPRPGMRCHRAGAGRTLGWCNYCPIGGSPGPGPWPLAQPCATTPRALLGGTRGPWPKPTSLWWWNSSSTGEWSHSVELPILLEYVSPQIHFIHHATNHIFSFQLYSSGPK